MPGEAATAMVLAVCGSLHQSHGTDNVATFINLTVAQCDKPLDGYSCLAARSKASGPAFREQGQKHDQLPSHRKSDALPNRAHVAAIRTCAAANSR